MLKQRIITASLLLPPTVAAILWLPQWMFAVVLAAVGAIGASEWAVLSGLSTARGRAVYIAFVTIVLLAVGLSGLDGLLSVVLPAAAVVWGLWALVWILRYPGGRYGQPSARLRAALGLLVLPSAIEGLLDVRAGGLGVPGLLTLFVLVWSADVGAYFAGRALGRHKLAPAVSPGKTWEGFAGGMLFALAAGTAAHRWWLPQLDAVGEWRWLLFCVVVAAASVVGDLLESLLKRIAGVKDSGTLLPGHGGVLDRIDSLLSAAPVMALGLYALGF